MPSANSSSIPSKSYQQDGSVLLMERVDIGYGGSPVIHDLSLQVSPGGIFGLIGLNGAGKTTLIKAILALRKHEAGQIKVFGDHPGQAKDKIAFLPERFDPPWFLTGLEFLRFSLKLYGLRVTDERFVHAAEGLQLAPQALTQKIKSYSKGMRQKLGLLATFMTECPFLILDEPMSGLDPVARLLVKDRILELKAKGITVFLSSHILADMDEICDQIGVIHNGVLVYFGTPSKLKQKEGSDSLERAFLKLVQERV